MGFKMTLSNASLEGGEVVPGGLYKVRLESF